MKDWPPLPRRIYPWYPFLLEAESNSGSQNLVNVTHCLQLQNYKHGGGGDDGDDDDDDNDDDAAAEI
jgi:hypothetical protein